MARQSKNMSVEFNQHEPLGYNYQSKKSGGITNLFIKMGLAKDEKGAQNIMVIVAIICFALAIYIVYKSI